MFIRCNGTIVYWVCRVWYSVRYDFDFDWDCNYILLNFDIPNSAAAVHIPYTIISIIDACQIALQNCNAQPLSVVIKMYCNHYRCLDELCGQPGELHVLHPWLLKITFSGFQIATFIAHFWFTQFAICFCSALNWQRYFGGRGAGRALLILWLI